MSLHFQAEQWLPYSVEQVFAFFADPDNLPRLMPDWQKARIEKSTFVPPPPPPYASPWFANIAAGSGTRLILTIRPFPYSPVRLPWDALIEDFCWNRGFCDVQVRGPFRAWRHCHSIEPTLHGGTAGTHLRDSVTYELPLGPLGTLANQIFIRNQLARTFRYRHRRTLELLRRAAPPTPN
jgi:ligand-binding SRPBCC domain-containing protein